MVSKYINQIKRMQILLTVMTLTRYTVYESHYVAYGMVYVKTSKAVKH